MISMKEVKDFQDPRDAGDHNVSPLYRILFICTQALIPSVPPVIFHTGFLVECLLSALVSFRGIFTAGPCFVFPPVQVDAHCCVTGVTVLAITLWFC